MQLYAKDIMTSPVITMEGQTSCASAMRILMENNISGAPVVNEAGEMVGLVSMKDLLVDTEQLLPPPSFYDNMSFNCLSWDESTLQVSPGTVEQVMSKHVYTAAPNALLSDVARTLYKQRIHRVVIAEDDEPLGMVSTFDLLRAMAETSSETRVA